MGDESRLSEHPVGGIERLNGAVVVRLIGELDLYNAPQVRAALLEVCAEQPERLVVDLRRGGLRRLDRSRRPDRSAHQAREPPVVPAGLARARDPPRPHDLRPRPAPLRARHGRVCAGGLGSRLMLAELSATALLLSGVGAPAKAQSPARVTANGIPAYVNGYAKWPRLNRVPIRAGSSAHQGTKNVYASKRKTGIALSDRDDHRQDGDASPGRNGSPSSRPCARSEVRRTAAGAGRSSRARRRRRGSRRSASPSPAAPPAIPRPSRTTSSSRGADQPASSRSSAGSSASESRSSSYARRTSSPAGLPLTARISTFLAVCSSATSSTSCVR